MPTRVATIESRKEGLPSKFNYCDRIFGDAFAISWASFETSALVEQLSKRIVGEAQHTRNVHYDTKIHG
jgi:hypothetical protein